MNIMSFIGVTIMQHKKIIGSILTAVNGWYCSFRMWGVISYSVIVESIITERVHVAENREVVTGTAGMGETICVLQSIHWYVVCVCYLHHTSDTLVTVAKALKFVITSTRVEDISTG